MNQLHSHPMHQAPRPIKHPNQFAIMSGNAFMYRPTSPKHFPSHYSKCDTSLEAGTMPTIQRSIKQRSTLVPCPNLS